MAISLGGCKTDGLGATPAVIAAGAVDLPAACEAILRQQPVVRPKLGNDYRVLFRRAQNGQVVANSVIRQAQACMEYQRKLYGGS